MDAWTAGFAIGVMLVGCSSNSSGSGGNCGKVAPCGGDIVGTWKVVDSCADSAQATTSTGSCPGETLQVASFSASGTITFNADMTYTDSLTESASATATAPTSCLSTGGIPVSCDRYAKFLADVTPADAGASTTCAVSGSTCSCHVILSGLVVHEMGTYSLSGNTFSSTVSPSTAMGNAAGYCVQGNTLHITSTLMGMGNAPPAPAMGVPATDIVATSQ
jgi:hypothetical protein